MIFSRNAGQQCAGAVLSSCRSATCICTIAADATARTDCTASATAVDDLESDAASSNKVFRPVSAASYRVGVSLPPSWLAIVARPLRAESTSSAYGVETEAPRVAATTQRRVNLRIYEGVPRQDWWGICN